jgi:peptidoglycan hydrolase CwlO-like protein
VDNNLLATIVIQSVIFLGALAKIHQDVQIKLKELDVRLTAVERQDDEIYAKLDKLMNGIQEIKIELQNKQNRNQ